MLLDVVRWRPWKLVILAGLVIAFALALPDSTGATSLNEVKKLTASNAGAADWFGGSVAMSGDTVVVGARNEDFGGLDTGAAYVFRRDEGGAGNWGEVTKLTSSDVEVNDVFGVSVAVSGDTAVVGAPGGFDPGAAYVFQRNQGGAGNWGEVTKLTSSDGQISDLFGASVAVSGDTAVVGSFFEDAGGVNAGAAYVFQRNEGGQDNWGEVRKLTASDAEAGDWFGVSVAVSGDSAVVGAFFEDAGGDDNAGAAYVFQRNEGGADNWGEVKKLTASDAEAGDQFGFSVAVSGDTAVVGASFFLRLGGSSVVGAYIFQRGAGNWDEAKKLTASDAEAGDSFGVSVAVSGDTAVVGASGETVGGAQTGAAYVFQRDFPLANFWGEVKKPTASDAQDGDRFGASVAVSGEFAIVGAITEDAGGPAAGAAYVFDLLGIKSTPTSTPADTPAPPATDTPVPTSTPVATATPDVSPGDANCDNTVNAVDAALVLQFNAGLLSSLSCAGGADVNHDGSINSIDAALILQLTAGLLGSLPPP